MRHHLINSAFAVFSIVSLRAKLFATVIPAVFAEFYSLTLPYVQFYQPFGVILLILQA